MMEVTFLGHSGFLVELDSAALLFDWCSGDLPPLPEEKALLVFVSHRHEDHFSPAVFRLADDRRPIRFLLGEDLPLTPENRTRWGLSDSAAARCLCLHAGGTAAPLPGVTVETLPSTDEGVAFLVRADGRTVFHSGDLNWWHWAGEDPAWNQAMAEAFLADTRPLAGRTLDLAMLPLDPRLGEDGFRGPAHILDLAEIRCFLPMHQWGDFGFTDRFLAAFPRFVSRTIPIRAQGQRICLP